MRPCGPGWQAQALLGVQRATRLRAGGLGVRGARGASPASGLLRHVIQTLVVLGNEGSIADQPRREILWTGRAWGGSHSLGWKGRVQPAG